jgi:hypothetical protein
MSKTIHVEKVLDYVNDMLATSTCVPDVRHGMILVLSEILHKTDNYVGFRYLLDGEVPEGQEPGIRWSDGERTDGYRDREYPDDTRRQYGMR